LHAAQKGPSGLMAGSYPSFVARNCVESSNAPANPHWPVASDLVVRPADGPLKISIVAPATWRKAVSDTVPFIATAPATGTTLPGPGLMAVGAVTPLPVHAATLRASSATICFHRFTTHPPPDFRNSRASNISEHSNESPRELPGISQVPSRGPFVRIRFAPFTLDFDTRQLTREGREIHL
jgi:hypothetical protein